MQMNGIQGIQTGQLYRPNAASGVQGAPTPGVQGTTPGKSFKDILLDSINEVNSMQQTADQAVEKIMTGGEISPAEVLTAVQKADIAFRMMMQIRNKISAAYDEIKGVRV